MDAELNPYTPGSGLRPPELVGREAEILAVDTLIARVGNGLSGDRGLVLSGLRGVGKTVLLNHLRNQFDNRHWVTAGIEAMTDDRLAKRAEQRFAREVGLSVRRLSRTLLKRQASALMATVQSFAVSVGLQGISAEVKLGAERANSGMLDLDLEELVEDVAQAAGRGHRGFAVFVDEMQDLSDPFTEALVAVQHRAAQKGWPFFVFGAGLPTLPAKLAESRSYAERLFEYRTIGPLRVEDSRDALVRPIERVGGSFSEDALEVLTAGARGYPYFLQEFGRTTWDLALTPRITGEDAELGVSAGLDRLDEGFFPSRWIRLTDAERVYARAMAVSGDGETESGLVAARLGKRTHQVSGVRDALIRKGVVYSPEYGRVAFTVPGMADFIRRMEP